MEELNFTSALSKYDCLRETHVRNPARAAALLHLRSRGGTAIRTLPDQAGASTLVAHFVCADSVARAACAGSAVTSCLQRALACQLVTYALKTAHS